MFTKLNLERSGKYEVTTASSGEEGLEQVKATTFDLVITDFRMPGMDGTAVLRSLKAMRPHSPVVLYSVYHDDDATITPDVRSQADGLVAKPMDAEQLSQTIEDALAGKK